MIIQIILTLGFMLILLSFISLRLALALYIASLLLIPYWSIPLGPLTVSYNALNILFLIIYLVKEPLLKKDLISFSNTKPFLLLFISLFCLIPFQWETPFSYQVSNFFASFIKVIPISLVIWNVGKNDSTLVKNIKIAVIVSIIIAGLYGIILTNLGGLNPYTSFIANYYGLNDSAKSYSFLESRVGFSNAGKIQSTTVHPMLWGLHLSLIFIILLYFTFKLKKHKYMPIYISILVLVIFNILVSGVRTAIAAIIMGLTYLFLINFNKKSLFYLFGALVIFLFIVSANSDLRNLFISMIDFGGKPQGVEGSSFAMRVNQFAGVFDEIRGHELIGKGFGWDSYYRSINGDHPVLLAFESIIFVVLCNGGAVGFLIWAIFFILLFVTNENIVKQKGRRVWANTLLIVYITYTIGTGDYGYMQFLAIYYTFFLLVLRHDAMRESDFNKEI